MKPYLVHKTWIDLDHVVAINSEVCHARHISCADYWLCSFTGSCEIIYREKSLGFELEEGGKNWSDEKQAEVLDRAQQKLDDLIAAWKAKDGVPSMSLREWVDSETKRRAEGRK